MGWSNDGWEISFGDKNGIFVDRAISYLHTQVVWPLAFLYAIATVFPSEEKKREDLAAKMFEYELAVRRCEQADSIARQVFKTSPVEQRQFSCRFTLQSEYRSEVRNPIWLHR